MKQFETDVAVIGAGTSGLAACVAAAEKGARVIAFEKARTTGGTGNMGMGPFAVESKVQKKKNVKLSREEAFKIFMDYTHWRVDARLVSNYLNMSASTIDWIEKMGVEWVDAIAYVHGAYETHHLVRPATGGRPGPQASATMMKVLTDRATALKVQFVYQTTAKKLIKDKGIITGFVGEDAGGEQIQVKAKSVIIACGGFGDNPDMIKKYTGFEWGKTVINTRIPGLTGDGLRMAWEAGAGTEGLNMELTCGVVRGNPTGAVHDPTTASPAMAAFRQPNMIVNVFGDRFMNEDASGNPTFTGNAVSRQKGGCAFMIFDRAIARVYETEELDWMSYMDPITQIRDFDGEIKKVLAANPYIFEADTIEELAQKMGINPANLKKSVEEYNSVCASGRDEVFHKNPRFLRPIQQPKFYGGKMIPGAYGSLGGIKINYKLEVVTKDQDPIPGLYAVGVDSNSIFADSYIFIFPGNTQGFALNSGRMAGQNAAEYAKKS